MKKIFSLILILVSIFVIIKALSLYESKSKRKEKIKIYKEKISKDIKKFTYNTGYVENKKELDSKSNVKQISLENIFSNTIQGESIINIIKFYSYMDDPSSKEAKVAYEAIDKLNKTPYKSFEELKNNLKKLPTKYEVQRQFLYQTINDFKINQEDKTNFYKEELQNSINNIDTKVQSKYTPGIVFRLMTENENDVEEVENTINNVINKVPRETQALLISTYNKISPEKAKNLAKEIGFIQN
jgi:hypothetical protein